MFLFQLLIIFFILLSVPWKAAAGNFSWNIFPKGFSADYIETVQEKSHEPKSRKGKIFYSKNKYRFNISADGKDIDVIIRLDKDAHWFLLPQKNIYIEKILNSDDAISQEVLFENWVGEKPANVEIYNKQKINVYDHHTDNCKVRDYISPQTDFPLKIDITCKGLTEYHRVLEFRNIQDKEPDQSLFDIPDGYQKVSQ